MAYRRFVSYIYEYPDGKKGENCGFVRVEVRNGICQMAFWMKPAGFPKENSLRVFGLTGKENRLLGILIGEINAGPGGVRGRVSFPELRIGNGAWRMDQLKGLLLLSEGGRKFATQWEDEPLRLERFEEWSGAGETPDEKQEEAGSRSGQPGAKEELRRAEHRTDEEGTKEEPQQAEHRTDEEEMKEVQGRQTQEKDSEKKTSPDSKTEMARPLPEGLQAAAAERPGEGKIPQSSQHRASEKENGEMPGKNEDFRKEEPENTEGQSQDKNVGTKEQKSSRKPETEEKRILLAAEIPFERRTACRREYVCGCPGSGKKEKKEGAPEGRKKGGTDRKRQEPWEFVQNSCPRFQPFPDDRKMECVRMGRQEILMLQRMGWQIESNPFTNHGLQQFRHLLLGRDAVHPQVYYLGVPGIFNTSEQFMAGMFGFGQFRAANPPKEGRPGGTYGYWCRMVRPPFGENRK